MTEHPFALLRQFQDRLGVALFTKSDDIPSDAASARAIGAVHAAGLNQVHGKRSIVVRAASARTEEADGMLTDVYDLALCIRVADCQSFVIFAPEKNVLGILHAGWRGLIAGAISEFFRVMKEEWKITPSETYIGAGPSLCSHCAEFTDPSNELPSFSKELIHGKHADLQGAATAELLKLGVQEKNFERHSDCTKCHPDLYWTYRGGDREAVKQGRTNMLACAMR